MRKYDTSYIKFNLNFNSNVQYIIYVLNAYVYWDDNNRFLLRSFFIRVYSFGWVGYTLGSYCRIRRLFDMGRESRRRLPTSLLQKVWLQATHGRPFWMLNQLSHLNVRGVQPRLWWKSLHQNHGIWWRILLSRTCRWGQSWYPHPIHCKCTGVWRSHDAPTRLWEQPIS